MTDPRSDELVLPGAAGTPFSGWSKSKRGLDNAIVDARAKAAVKSGTSAPRHLSHGAISGSRGGIVGVYQRHDWASEKRAALDAWAAHVVSIVKGRAADYNVVTLARAV